MVLGIASGVSLSNIYAKRQVEQTNKTNNTAFQLNTNSIIENTEISTDVINPTLVSSEMMQTILESYEFAVSSNFLEITGYSSINEAYEKANDLSNQVDDLLKQISS